MSRTTKITSATAEQWRAVEALRAQRVAAQTETIAQSDAEDQIQAMWAAIGYDRPAVHFAASPMAAVTLAAKLTGSTLSEVRSIGYYSIWWRVWAGWYRGGEILGVKFDGDQLDRLDRWARSVPYIVPYDTLAVVSANPTDVRWDDRRRLHSLDSPAVSFSDGWGVYSVEGVRVPADIVTNPEKITVGRIKAEPHAEVRRIMRQQYGDQRYLTDTGATVIDSDHESCRGGAAPRMLVEDDEKLRWLVGTDGSTGRVYFMRVPANTKTCREAHEALCGFDETTISLKG